MKPSRIAAASYLAPTFLAAWTCAASLPAWAQPTAGPNLFVQAMVEGRASGPVPDALELTPVLRALQRQTGDPGLIVIEAMRLQSFVQQPRCGRVAFGLAQPTSHAAWPAIGGEINICADGLPPLQVCKDRPAVLVPAGSLCPDKAPAQDTAEVIAAIQAAIARGGLTHEQVRAQLVAKPASTPPSDATGTGVPR